MHHYRIQTLIWNRANKVISFRGMRVYNLSQIAAISAIVLTPEVYAAVRQSTSKKMMPSDMTQQAPTSSVQVELPFAQGRSFASLDEYLAFRQRRGAHGVPWYRRITGDRYELVSRRGPGAAPVIHTRAELAKKFGFAH